jgi:hypothetical protein
MHQLLATEDYVVAFPFNLHGDFEYHKFEQIGFKRRDARWRHSSILHSSQRSGQEVLSFQVQFDNEQK